MSDYDILVQGGFVGNLVEMRRKNPHAVWIANSSCEKVAVPDLVAWLSQHRSLGNIFLSGTSTQLKPYAKSLFDSGKGNKDAASITMVIAEWKIPEHLATGGRDVGTRRVLIGTGSLNQDVTKRGQVHAEHITTAVVIDKLDEVANHYGWRGAELMHLDALIYTAKLTSKNVGDFAPCASCQKTVREVLGALGDKLRNVHWLGEKF